MTKCCMTEMPRVISPIQHDEAPPCFRDRQDYLHGVAEGGMEQRAES